MAKKNNSQRAALQCTKDIFLNPPVSRADLATRLRGVDSTTVRRLLVNALEQGKIGADESFIFVEAMNCLGPGHQKRRLLKIASDRRRTKPERSYAFLAIGPENLTESDPILSEIGADLAEEVMGYFLRNLFMLPEDEMGLGVVDILAGLPSADFAPQFLEMLDEQRGQARVPAYIAYEYALQDTSLSGLHSRMISAIEQEGHSLGIALLQSLGSQSADRSTQKELFKTALKARSETAGARAAREAPKGYALVSSCDGQGAVSILACLKNKDGSSSLANVCLRVDREIRDGFYLHSISENDIDDLTVQQQLGANINFVRVSLDEAATMVHSAVEQNKKRNVPIALDAQRAIACLPHSYGSLQLDRDDKPLLTEEYSAEDYEGMLDHPEYNSWFFDLADLQEVGMTLPDDCDDDCYGDLVDEVSQKLDTPIIKERLLAMNRYMAWWCHKNEDEEFATMHLQAVKSISDSFKESPFVKAMVVQSFFMARSRGEVDDEEIIYHVGNEHLRRNLRGMFFADIKIPRGRDVAVLDFTEATYLAFEDLFESLPGDIRPGPNVLSVVSYNVGKIIAEMIIKKLPGSPDQLILKVAHSINKATEIGQSQNKRLATMVVSLLFDFTENVCRQCGIACWLHPKQNMADVFFDVQHPSTQ